MSQAFTVGHSVEIIKHQCFYAQALESIARTHFDGDIMKILCPGPINSITTAGGNSSAWMKTPESLQPLSPTTKAIQVLMAPSSISESRLYSAEVEYNDVSLMKYHHTTRINIDFPSSWSSIDRAASNIDLELDSKSSSFVKRLVDLLPSALIKIFKAGIMRGNSNLLLINCYSSTGATGLIAPKRITDILRHSIVPDKHMRVDGFNMLQVSPLGSSATKEEAEKRYDYLTKEILEPYIRGVSRYPLILIPFDMRERASNRFATNKDIALISRLIDAVASAKYADVAGDVSDIMKSVVAIPSRMLSHEVIEREGIDVVYDEALTGDLVRKDDDIVEWNRPIIIAYASNRALAKAILNNARRSKRIRDLGSNSMVIRYDDGVPGSQAFLMALFPIKTNKYGNLLERLRKIIVKE